MQVEGATLDTCIHDTGQVGIIQIGQFTDRVSPVGFFMCKQFTQLALLSFLSREDYMEGIYGMLSTMSDKVFLKHFLTYFSISLLTYFLFYHP